MSRRTSSKPDYRLRRDAGRARSRRSRMSRRRALARVLRVGLRPVGSRTAVVVEGERGEPIHYLRFPAAGSGSVGLRQALEEQEFELYAPGLHHLAFAVGSRDDVDAA